MSRGAGHARELCVHAEIVLDGDGGEGLVLLADVHPLLGLHRLVQPVGPAPARHEAAGELVDDDDLAFLDDVVHIALEDVVGLERLVHVVQGVDVGAGRRGCAPPAAAPPWPPRSR